MSGIERGGIPVEGVADMRIGGPVDAGVDPAVLQTAYSLVSSLLLHPEERDASTDQAAQAALAADGSLRLTLLDEFLASPRSVDAGEYLALLELAPPCPLYLGAHLFDEPSTCRGAGMSGRNAYMLELKAIYRHFGLELDGSEMADFLPMVVEFLSISSGRAELDGIGLRRRLIERFVTPALGPMREALVEYESPYEHLISFLEQLLELDVSACQGPAWEPALSGTDLPMIDAAVPYSRLRDGVVGHPEEVRR